LALPGIDHCMSEPGHELHGLFYRRNLEREPCSSLAPIDCVSRIVTIKKQGRSESLEVRGEMHRCSRFPDSSFMADDCEDQRGSLELKYSGTMNLGTGVLGVKGSLVLPVS